MRRVRSWVAPRTSPGRMSQPDVVYKTNVDANDVNDDDDKMIILSSSCCRHFAWANFFPT